MVPYPRFDLLGDAALLVTLGERIEVATSKASIALAAAVRTAVPSGVLDVVPAYTSVLVTFDPASTTASRLREEVKARLDARIPAAGAPATHTIPVVYGGESGPDLELVAESTGLSPSQIISLHERELYRVYFVGFMPGFAYLGNLPSQLQLPRRATPRVRVPSGSVAIAGEQTAIYPFSSPGGWHIIGRAGVPVWDHAREMPALLAPGDTVRFSAADEIDEPVARKWRPFVTDYPAFDVTEVSGITTVQDPGRPGFAHLGVPRGGSFDLRLASEANSLCGNASEEPVLEMHWSGPTLTTLRSCTIAVAGATVRCTVDGRFVPSGISWFVRGGSIIRFNEASSPDVGARSYLAVSGGFDGQEVLGSRSTYVPGTFGGYSRALAIGDVLGLHIPLAGTANRGGLTTEPANYTESKPASLHFLAFTGPGRVPNTCVEPFCEIDWIVSRTSDRMGIRLESPDGCGLYCSNGNVITFGVAPGTIQLPPDGRPIVLGVDHQTTGGYPVVGALRSADLSLLGQLKPGDEVRFVCVEPSDFTS